MADEQLSIEVVVPIYNEEKELRTNILRLYHFLEKKNLSNKWRIMIADNASNDDSGRIGKKLSKEYAHIHYLHLPKKGRGRAVKEAWSRSKADLYFYMDVDLSTDLAHLPAMVKALAKNYHIAIGSRLLADSKVVNRPMKREILSRGYNMLIKLLFQTNFSDAQCGFKGVTRNTVTSLLPYIQDDEWFFDSELLIVGEKAGYRIFEEPVKWVDNPGSTVRVLKTVSGDLKGLWYLFWARPWEKIKGPKNA